MHWILIATTTWFVSAGNYASTVSMQEFEGESTCLAAADTVRSQMRSQASSANVRAVCVHK